MKRLIVVVLSCACLVGIAITFAVSAEFAPNGKKDINLTVNSTTVDMRLDNGWALYTPTACVYRTMSTATKAGLKRTLPANTYNQRYVNPKTPFINFSGCTSGELQRQ